jgi:DNA polymerase-3 subunit beta
MKVILLQENFQKAVNQASKIINQKNQLAILSNLLLETTETDLIICSTNLETSLVIKIPAKIEEKGKICVPAKTLQEIVYSLKPEKITLEQKNHILEIICDQSRVKINSLSAKEYPNIPREELGQKKGKLSAAELLKICRQVAFAASIDESRPVLTGVIIKEDEKGTEAAATDGYRLSQKKMKTNLGLKEEVIIPARSIIEFSRMIEPETSLDLIIDKKKNQIIFKNDQVQLISRLLEGEFPSFSKIIPGSLTTEISLDKENFLQALKIASVFARESANIIKFRTKNQKLKISANAPQVGENETELEAEIKGEEAEIAFNYRFVQDFLNSINEDQLIIKISGSLSPAIFQPLKDHSYLHIIMPVRLQQGVGE